RVQVEHTVTEMATGIDIVKEQLRIAAGEPISFAQEELDLRGWSIECRINAEAAHKQFAPAPGSITTYREPAGPGVRVDSGVDAGTEITPLYDPMIAKLVVWDRDRESATARMLRALDEVEREYTVEVDARRFSVRVIGPPPAFGGGVAANSAGARPVPRRERAAGGP